MGKRGPGSQTRQAGLTSERKGAPRGCLAAPFPGRGPVPAGTLVRQDSAGHFAVDAGQCDVHVGLTAVEFDAHDHESAVARWILPEVEGAGRAQPVRVKVVTVLIAIANLDPYRPSPYLFRLLTAGPGPPSSFIVTTFADQPWLLAVLLAVQRVPGHAWVAPPVPVDLAEGFPLPFVHQVRTEREAISPHDNAPGPSLTFDVIVMVFHCHVDSAQHPWPPLIGCMAGPRSFDDHYPRDYRPEHGHSGDAEDHIQPAKALVVKPYVRLMPIGQPRHAFVDR